VGVTGWSLDPFVEPHFHDGAYQLVVTINAPEPGAMLQLVSGSAGLAWLQRRRNRKLRAGRSPKERDRDRCEVIDA
jgi:hypothetical protein